MGTEGKSETGREREKEGERAGGFFLTCLCDVQLYVGEHSNISENDIIASCIVANHSSYTEIVNPVDNVLNTNHPKYHIGIIEESMAEMMSHAFSITHMKSVSC